MVLSAILGGGVICTAINVKVRITRYGITQKFRLNQTKVVRLKTVNLTRFWYYGPVQNPIRMPVLKKYTGCPGTTGEQVLNTGTMC
jgi:hypothetical protein